MKKLLLGLTFLASMSSFAEVKVVNVSGIGKSKCFVGLQAVDCPTFLLFARPDKKTAKMNAIEAAYNKCETLVNTNENIRFSSVQSEGKVNSINCRDDASDGFYSYNYYCTARATVQCEVEF